MRKTSASDILLYESCPYRWHLTKTGHKDRKQMFAFYRFSSALHEAMKKHVAELEDPLPVFMGYWERYNEEYPLVYRDGETWDTLLELGKIFIEQFLREYPDLNIDYILTENRLRLTGEGWEYVGQPDMVGYRETEKRYIVVDYKTTNEEIDPAWVRVSDQMTGFAMLTVNEFMTKAPVDILICNFNAELKKTIWLWDTRTQKDIDTYKTKIGFICNQMDIPFYPRRGSYAFNSPCSWCDLKRICAGQEPVEASVSKKSGLSTFVSVSAL